MPQRTTYAIRRRRKWLGALLTIQLVPTIWMLAVQLFHGAHISSITRRRQQRLEEQEEYNNRYYQYIGTAAPQRPRVSDGSSDTTSNVSRTSEDDEDNSAADDDIRVAARVTATWSSRKPCASAMRLSCRTGCSPNAKTAVGRTPPASKSASWMPSCLGRTRKK